MTTSAAAPSVLVVEDDLLVLDAMQEALNVEGLSCRIATNLAAARHLLASGEFDLVLLDVVLPDGSGLDLLPLISELHPSTAVVMTTGLDDIGTGRATLDRGAIGYLVKPFSLNQLRIQVAAALRWHAGRDGQRSDPLEPVSTALRQRDAIAIAIDLELPLVSALWGAESATLLGETARARLESCSLAFEATAVSSDGVYAVPRRSRPFGAAEGDEVWRLLHEPYRVGTHHAMIRPAIGIARRDLDGDRSQVMHARAAAMHVRLERGSGWGEYSEATRRYVTDRLELAADLQQALETGALHLAYQSQVDLETGQVHAIEALVRWRHPERGDVAPSTFVPIAEQHGLIHALGDWVIDRACADLAARRSSSVDRVPTLSVNVSPYQLAGDGLIDAIKAALAANDLPPQALCVEITESVALEHTSGIVEHINELARLGVGISVDDLGAGYASFGRLADCPWTQVKIDRSLVSRLEDPAARQVALAIIELGARLGVEVIAEGVERAEQAALLRELGCHLAQGFLYGRPAPMEQLLAAR